MLESEVRSMLAIVENPQADAAALTCCASQLLLTATQSDLEERQTALDRLASVFAQTAGIRAGCLSVVCGALIEHGCHPDSLASPLFLRIQDLLPKAIELYDRCSAHIHQPSDEAADPGDLDARFQIVLQQYRGEFPALDAAWTDLDRFAPATIAVLSTCPQWRNMAYCFQEPLKHIMDCHQAARWLVRLLAVVDGAPLLLIEPATRSGWQTRMSGVADNYQLQTLLLATISANASSVAPPSAHAVNVARGIGPQQSRDEVAGRWDLYSWHAVQPDLRLPANGHAISQACKIRDEGLPAEIPRFAEQHVLLLGPRTQPLRWVSQRPFGHLKANLQYEHALTADACRNWLQRMSQQSGHE